MKLKSDLKHFLKKCFKKISIHTKKYLTIYAVCVVSALIFSALVGIAYGKIALKKNQYMEKSRTIILDAGHGGEDGGAVGFDGITEKNINLAIALKLQNFLESAGYEVIMTREEDAAIYDDNATTLREKKRSDLKNRANIIKSSEEDQDNAIFVSVHQNKFPNPRYFGTQIFFSKNNEKSRDLANCVKDSIVGLIQPGNTREIKPATSKIYLLNNAGMPAIVVECGFLSNEEEAKKLVQNEYQEQIAFCIFCGISNYFANI